MLPWRNKHLSLQNKSQVRKPWFEFGGYLRLQRVYVGGSSQEQALALFEQWCVAHRAQSCELGLSARWVRSLTLPQEILHMSRADQLAYVQRQLVHYFDASGGSGISREWAIAISSEPRMALACATSRVFIDRLVEISKRYTVKIHRILPWWARSTQKLMQKTVLKSAVLVASELGQDSDFGFREEASSGSWEIVTFQMIQDGRLSRIMTDLCAPNLDHLVAPIALIATKRSSQAQKLMHASGSSAVSWHEMRMPEIAINAGVSSCDDVRQVLSGAAVWTEQDVHSKYQAQASSWNL